jgi:hypothetical protein
MDELTDFDRDAWIFLHNDIIDTGRFPTVAEAAAKLGAYPAEFDAALDRLHANHHLALREDIREFLMVHPFSPVPTPHTVTCSEQSWWANCFWDALGISPMLDRDGRIESSCGCCDTAAAFEVNNAELAGGEGVVHFAVPARDWWNDVAFT